MVDYKIYIKGNYFIIENTLNGEIQHGHKKEVFVDKNNQKKLIYRIFNVKEWNYSNSLQLSQILKEDGTSYTQNEWETFYTENTGNFNSGAVLAPQILDALNNANSPSATNPFLTESDDRVKDITSLNYNSINSTIDITFIDQDGISQTLTTSFINVGIKYNVLNYNDLLLVTPSPSLYDLAYVRQSQGIQWLPGSLGGTYYGKGLYMFDGVNWVEDDTDILQALNTLVGASHTHSNLSILNNITEAFTTSLKSLYDSAEISITNLLTTGQRLITTTEINKLLNTSGVNSGDQTTIVGISGTKAQFNTACTDGDFLYVGDVVTSLKTKSGVVTGASFTGNPKKITITFTTPFPDSNYTPSVNGISSRIWSTESITANSFIINSNANTAPTGNVYWSVIKHGEN